MKYGRKKLFFSFCFLTVIGIFFCFLTAARAAQLYFESSNKKMATGETIEVDLILDTEDEVLNAYQGRMVFPNDLFELQAIQDGGSIISFWIRRPVLENNTIFFAGITPGGFIGKEKLFSFSLFSKKEGQGNLSIEEAEVLRHDGFGSNALLAITELPLIVSQQATASSTPRAIDRVPPEPFMPRVTFNANIFDGRYFLVFNTQDKDSGIARYAVFESKDKVARVAADQWVESESPYLLQDQSLTSYIFVKAVDRAGNEQMAILTPAAMRELRPNYRLRYIGGGTLLILLIVLFFIRRQMRKKKANLSSPSKEIS